MTDNESFFEELKRDVDSDHHRIDGADSPPADLWPRILTQANPQPKENNQMSSNTIAAMPMALANPVAPGRRRGFGHFLNLAATIALVLVVAAAGWFATMQLNHPGGPQDSRFALLGQTDEAAVCNVDPLTADDVMEIVRNPYRYLYERADQDTRDRHLFYGSVEPDLVTGYLVPSYETFSSVNRTTPSSSIFEDASQAVDQYIQCMRDATNGQYWALVDPVWVQQFILWNFPVFVDEQDVAEYVEDTIDQPVDLVYNRLHGFYDTYGEVEITANPNIEHASQIMIASPDAAPIVAFGVHVSDEDGDVIIETGSTGYPHQIRPGSITNRPVIVVQQSPATGDWYVLPWLGQHG